MEEGLQTDNHENNIAWITIFGGEVVDECLRCHVKDTSLLPLIDCQDAVYLKHKSGDTPFVTGTHEGYYLSTPLHPCLEYRMSDGTHRFVEQRGASLARRRPLFLQGTSGRLEGTVSCLIQGRAYANSQFSMTTPAMKVFPRPVGRATSVLSNRQCLTILNW